MTQPVEASLFANILFWVVAFVSIASAIAVIQLKDLFRAALALILSFITVAVFFVMLRAEFLAAIQVLVYVGAVSVLIVFAILMTRDVQQGNPSNRYRIPALAVATLLLVSIAFVVANTQWTLIPEVPSKEMELVYSNTTPWIGRLLLRNFILPFEAAAVLLLAAIIGALALVRER